MSCTWFVGLKRNGKRLKEAERVREGGPDVAIRGVARDHTGQTLIILRVDGVATSYRVAPDGVLELLGDRDEQTGLETYAYEQCVTEDRRLGV